jgi:hypothetical protein
MPGKNDVSLSTSFRSFAHSTQLTLSCSYSLGSCHFNVLFVHCRSNTTSPHNNNPNHTIHQHLQTEPSLSFSGAELLLSVKPVCMGFEDYYAAFTSDSHPSFSVSPVAGRMDRRGGEPTELVVKCNPQGRAGEFVGNLVVNLPEDNSKICYRVTATSF